MMGYLRIEPLPSSHPSSPSYNPEKTKQWDNPKNWECNSCSSGQMVLLRLTQQRLIDIQTQQQHPAALLPVINDHEAKKRAKEASDKELVDLQKELLKAQIAALKNEKE